MNHKTVEKENGHEAIFKVYFVVTNQKVLQIA